MRMAGLRLAHCRGFPSSRLRMRAIAMFLLIAGAYMPFVRIARKPLVVALPTPELWLLFGGGVLQ